MTHYTRALVALFAIPAAVVALSSRARGVAEPDVVVAAPAVDAPLAAAATLDTAVFAGGCFWGVEAVFEHLKGVTNVESGYAGGKVASPSYEQVSTGDTGHAESVRVVYDPSKISYGQLLQVFFSVAHDPTTLNRQGPDHGTQYRSAIFYRTPDQKRIAEAYVAQLTAAKTFRHPIVTQIAPLQAFYLAEGYHQNYLVNHPNQPYIVINDRPKVENLKKQFSGLYRE
jgi:peptide-methionine (S)-S-oxide reductase